MLWELAAALLLASRARVVFGWRLRCGSGLALNLVALQFLELCIGAGD
jgi:hypothetical protein